MRLYKMELYKICSKKIFMIGVVCIIGIMLLYFGIMVADEEATVDGTKYTGFRAVQVNREITEEFRGVLTDEKIEKIIEMYGFPSKVEEGWGYFRDANFLNQFVMNYFSDGYIRNWNEYRAATQVYTIANSLLIKVIEFTGKDIVLEYYNGWRTFMEILSVGMVLGSILIMFSLSGIFAGEGQTKMLALLFTTKEGKTQDITMKIAAACTVSVAIWLGIFLLDFILCGVVYGFDGLDCYNGMVLYNLFPSEELMIPMRHYLVIALLLSFFGVFSLGFITICISAYYRSSFHAVIMTAVCYMAPLLMMMFAGGFYGFAMFLSAAPIFMVIYRIIEDIYAFWHMPIGIAIVVSVLCAIISYRKYNKQC